MRCASADCALCFVAQVTPIPQAALRAEQGGIAQLFHCPMHELGLGILPFLQCAVPGMGK